MDIATFFYNFSITLNVFIIITCLLLTLFATRALIKKNDIKLIILIANLELLIAILLIVDYIYTQVTRNKFILNHTACTLTGFFYEVIAYLEVLFNAFLAIKLLLVYKKSKVIRIVKRILFISSIIFFILLTVCMAIGAFIRGSTNYICHLNVANYTLAAFTYFFRDFVCVSTVLIIIYCYYETSKKVNRFRKVHDIEIKLSTSHKKRYRESEVAITKNYISLTAYGLLMFIGNILFSIETILACLNKARFINAIDPLHHVGLIFFGFGFFANTTLILFFHTGIKHEAEEFREQVKKIFKK